MIFKQRFEFSEYGEDFKDSYMIVKLLKPAESLSWSKKLSKAASKVDVSSESEENQDKGMDVINVMIDKIKFAFIGGEIFDEDKLRPLTKEDLKDLPMMVIKDISNFVEGVTKKG